MPHQETRVGYITFEGLDGPRRLFYFDEPLALGLLRVLERAAASAGGSGMAGELDPTLHDPEFLEAKRRERAADEARRKDEELSSLIDAAGPLMGRIVAGGATL